MNKKEVNELKRRFTKEGATFTKISGCYVNSDKEKLVSFTESFLNLEDDESLKYLEITKKVLSGNIGDNLLTLDYDISMEGEGTAHQSLMAVRDSELKQQPLMDAFFDQVIENYSYAGNYLILMFYDVYDVMSKTSDGLELDESAEAFKYLLCAVCPVELSKPGLGYLADEGRIGPRIRDWVVGMPDTGFLFPAFNDRTSDIHSILFYSRDTKNPHRELMENGLGAGVKNTATQKQSAFKGIIKHAVGDEDKTEQISLDIYEKLSDITKDNEDADDELMTLTADNLKDIVRESGVSDDTSDLIVAGFEEKFGENLPEAEYLIDKKALKTIEANAEKKELMDQVKMLKAEVDYQRSVNNDEANDTSLDISAYDVIMHVKPAKVAQIHSEVINGRRCIVIPMEENEHASVNGVNTTC